MCFNVFAGNCDDHMRNFSFLYDRGARHLSPAYDLTPNPGFFGEHSVLVNGKGADIAEDDLLAVGAGGSMNTRSMKAIIQDVRETVRKSL